MRAPAPVLVHVFGDVGQMREIAERADDFERLRDRQLVEQAGELVLDRRRVVRRCAAQTDRRLPDRLDAGIAALARLGAQHVAEEASQQSRIFLERQILVGDGVHLRQAILHRIGTFDCN